MKPALLISLWLLAPGVGGASPLEERDLAVANVTVVPMDSERVLPNQTVVIRDGVVDALRPSDELEVPADCDLIDGSGKYLLPGLSDMHAHVWDEDSLVLFVARGVTTTRNMFGHPVHLGWRERVRAGELFGPTIYTGGPIVDGSPPAASGGVVVSTPLEAANAVRAQAEAGYDFVKVYSKLSPESYDAIVETAQELDLPVAGHVPVRVGLHHALASGQVTVEHLTTYQLLLLREDSAYGVPGSIRSLRDALLSWEDVDRSRFAEVVAPAAASGAWNCPTLVVSAAKTPADEYGTQLARPEMRYVPQDVLDRWTRDSQGVRALSSDDRRRVRATVRTRQELVKALHDGGCGILLGTDCMNPFVVPGFSVHEELQLLVEAGLTPFEALATGTRNAARALGREDQFGTISPGQRADLLLLEANPFEDVAHAAELAGVVLRGRWHSSDDLDRRLEEIAQR